MKFFRNLFLGFGIALISTCAWAQSTPNLSYGDVPTAAQWNSFFAAKQDTLGYIPLNSSGGVMTGELTTAASATNSSGFNLPQGLAPTSPANGDLWTTSAGLFVRVAGTTLGPLGTAACPSCVTTNVTNTFTAYQVINLNAAAVPTVATGSILQLTQADTTVGRVEMDTFGAAAVFTGFRADGTNASPTTLVANDEIVAVNAWGYDGAARSTAASASMRAYAAATWSNTSHATYIDFSTTPISSLTLTSAAHVENDGGITVGGAASQGAGTINLLNGLYNNGSAPTGTGGYVRATAPTIASPTFSGTVAGPATIPNGVLINSTLVVGTTTISLGGTAATLTGLTLTTPTINGATLAGTLSGTPTLSGTNFVTLGNIVQDPTGFSLLGNTASGTANYAPFTIGSLTNKTVPIGADILLLQDSAASGALKFCTLTQCIGGLTAGVSSIDSLTGAFTTSNGLTSSGNSLQLTAARRTLPTFCAGFSGGTCPVTGTAATYTTPANVLYIEVRYCGAGGGGGGTTNGTTGAVVAGASGGNSIFNSINASGGSGGLGQAAGNAHAQGGPGGTGGAGTATLRQPGSPGGDGFISAATVSIGSVGGSSFCGGGAASPSAAGATAGVAAAANSGGGGSGAIGGSATNVVGSGGGGGEMVYLQINSPTSTYTYTIGTGGTGGVGGTLSGGAGGSGRMYTIEHYGS